MDHTKCSFLERKWRVKVHVENQRETGSKIEKDIYRTREVSLSSSSFALDDFARSYATILIGQSFPYSRSYQMLSDKGVQERCQMRFGYFFGKRFISTKGSCSMNQLEAFKIYEIKYEYRKVSFRISASKNEGPCCTISVYFDTLIMDGVTPKSAFHTRPRKEHVCCELLWSKSHSGIP